MSAFVGPPPIGPFVYDNPGTVDVVGLEAELTVLPVDGWRLTASYSFLEFLREDNVPSPLGGGTLNRNQPEHQVGVRSVVDLPADLEFDSSFYWVDGLGAVFPQIQPFTNNVRQVFRLDLRLGWQPTDWLEIALVGQNLLQTRHDEYNDVLGSQSTQVPRSGYVLFSFEL